MDLDVSRWILDFILRQPSLEDKTLDNLLRVLPVPVEDPTFKKALLVRSIVSEISKGVASEEMLVLMEHIEELDFQAGAPASQALKTAYCDVAVDFTVSLLQGSQANGYSEAVNRIWGERVGLMMESSENVGLLSEELRNWKCDIEASLERVDDTDSSLFCEDDDDLLKKWRGTNYETLKSIRVYVEEAWANMGPSFLEQVARNVGSDQIRKVLYPIARHHHGEDQQCRPRSNDEAAVGNRIVAMVKRSRILHPMRKCSRRGAKLSYEMEDSSVKKIVESVLKDYPPVGPSMGEGDKEVIDLELENENYTSKRKNENEGVIDLEVENENDASKKKNESVIDLGVEINGDENDASKKKNESVIDLGVEINGDENDASKKKNESVIDLEVENGDENDASKEKNESENDASKEKNEKETTGVHKGNDCGRRILPPSSTQQHIPLKRKDMNLQNGMRRRRKFWSNLEEDTLYNAVKMYGTGNWKFILKQYKDIFDERTEGDLKDKWRNMMR